MRKWMGVLAIAVLPAIAMAQDSTTTQGDSARGRGAMQRSGERTGTAHGRRSGRRSNMGLTSDQVRQLQQALNDAGCDVGSVDGVIGAHTRRGIACARQKNNVTGNNPNDLFRALNLGFTTSDSTGWDSAMRGGRSDDMMSDSTGAMRGRRGRGHMRDSSGTGHDSSGTPASSGLRQPNSVGSDTAGVSGRGRPANRSTSGRNQGRKVNSGLRQPNSVGSDTAGVSKTKKPPR